MTVVYKYNTQLNCGQSWDIPYLHDGELAETRYTYTAKHNGLFIFKIWSDKRMVVFSYKLTGEYIGEETIDGSPRYTGINSTGFSMMDSFTFPTSVTINPNKFKNAINGSWEDTIVNTTVPEIKCTCGMSIAMGKDDQLEFHSDWCDLKGKK